MPLYEYRCKQCARVFEVIQKFADEPVKTDPECGGEVERLISAPGLHFKGSGFYITDYGRSGGSPASKSKGDGGSDSKSESKSDSSKSDSKSESKSDTSKSDSKPASTTTTKKD